MNFQEPLLQSWVSHDPLANILIFRFGTQTFFIVPEIIVKINITVILRWVYATD